MRDDLQQIAGAPLDGAVGRRTQVQQPGRLALAARIQALPPRQRPDLEGRRFPGRRGGTAGHLGQAFLPLAQGRGVAIIDLHRGEQAPRALPLQPALHAPGEAAELLVLAISQGQQGVAQAIEAGGLAKHLAFEAAGAVRRLTVAEGADHEQRLARLGELPGIQRASDSTRTGNPAACNWPALCQASCSAKPLWLA